MKSTRIVMVGSSIVLGVAGVILLFVPLETLAILGFTDANELTGQLLGSLYLGFAAANWTARGSMIGGIYARPLSIANFVHFVVGGTVLAKGISAATFNAGYISLVLVYLAFAVLFILVLYGRLQRSGKPQSGQE